MAEFCNACAKELGFEGDFIGTTPTDVYLNGRATSVLCEGCGPIQVDPTGFCISLDCLEKGKPGHGTPAGEKTKGRITRG